MATYDRPPTVPPTPPEDVSGWAIGGITFATCILGMLGVFQIVAGLTAIFDDEFFVVTANYTFDLDTSAWGWVHLVIGIAMLATAVGLFSGSSWAGVAAVCFATLSAVVNFFFIPYYPFWSILVIALDVWVIWAITRPGALKA